MDFLDRDNIFAVIGVSRDPAKYGHKVFKDLKNAGYKVYPVNPKVSYIENSIKVYHSLSEIPVKPDVLITVVPPAVTIAVVKEAASMGITHIWMQPGSESDEVIEYCKMKKLKFMANSCIMISNNSQKKN